MGLHLLLPALLLVTVACGAQGSDDDDGGDVDVLTGSWQLVEGESPAGPVPVLEGHPITLTFEKGGGVSGTAACNHYFGEVTVEGDTIAVGELGATEMACEPQAAMEAERRYLDALAVVAAAERSGNELTLAGPGTRLVFAPLDG